MALNVDETLTVKQLKEIAKQKKITGYSRMKEAELIKAINEEPEMAKEEKKPAKKVENKKAPMANEQLFKVGSVVEVEETKFVVKEVKGVDLILARKDYK